MYTWILVFLLCSWKIETEMRRSKVTDYAALMIIADILKCKNVSKYDRLRDYKTWVHVSASSQSLRFILSLRLNSNFLTSRPGNVTITLCRPAHGIVRKRQRTITTTWHPKDYKSKATGSLFPRGMIAKVEKSQSTIRITKQKPTHKSHTQNLSTISNEWTTAQTTGRGIIFTGQFFTLDSTV